jgi:hypothetical protein
MTNADDVEALLARLHAEGKARSTGAVSRTGRPILQLSWTGWAEFRASPLWRQENDGVAAAD